MSPPLLRSVRDDALPVLGLHLCRCVRFYRKPISGDDWEVNFLLVEPSGYREQDADTW